MNKFENIRKWVIPDKMIIIAAGTKDLLLILKLREERDTHLTLVMKNNGYVELHHTTEKPYKSHLTILKGQLDILEIKTKAEKKYNRTLKPNRSAERSIPFGEQFRNKSKW